MNPSPRPLYSSPKPQWEVGTGELGELGVGRGSGAKDGACHPTSGSVVPCGVSKKTPSPGERTLSHEALSSALLAPHPWPWGEMAYAQSFPHPPTDIVPVNQRWSPSLPALTPKGLVPPRSL